MDFYKFDLRMASHLLKKSNGQLEAYMDQVKNGLAKAIVEGTCFLISIDDSGVAYEEIYDPDFKQFHSSEKFPSQIFNLKDLKVEEVYQRVLKGTQYQGSSYNKNFTILLWSKYKHEYDLSLNNMGESLVTRFGV